jgi:hypothetical protein
MQLCQEHLNKPFAALAPSQQDDVLKQIEKGSLTSPDLHLSDVFSGIPAQERLGGLLRRPDVRWQPGHGGLEDDRLSGRACRLSRLGRRCQTYPYGPVSIHGERG